MQTSTITLDVLRDEKNFVEKIQWSAKDTTINEPQEAKAFFLSLWDGKEKTSLRIDLWTKEMMVDEMADFFYQTFKEMAGTYERATRHQELAEEMRKFAEEFYRKSREEQLKQHKAS